MYYLKNKIFLFLLLILFLILYRFLLPFGDEPDFWIRAKSLTLGDSLPDTPFNILNSNFIIFLFNQADYLSLKCQFLNYPFTIWPTISHSLCSSDKLQILIRLKITLFFLTPLFFFLFYKFINFKLGYLSKSKLDNYFEISLLSLFTPSIMFHIGFLSIEAFVLCISLILMLEYKNLMISILCLLIIFFLDFGQFLIVALGFIIVHFSTIYYKYFKLKYFYLFLSIITIVMIYSKIFFFNNLTILLQNSNIEFLDYIARNLRHILNFEDKYPTLFRPIITYMGFVFYTPFYIKIIPLYLIFIVAILIKLYDYYFYSFIRNNNSSFTSLLNERFFIISNLIFIIILIAIILPSFVQAKYYLFIIPLIYRFLLTYTSFKNILIFLITSNLIVFIFLILFRII